MTLELKALRLPLCLGALVLCALLPNRAHADGGITVTAEPTPTYTFGETATFELAAASSARITSVTLFYRALPAAETRLGKPRFTPGALITATFSLSLTTSALPAFAQVEYWWEITDSSDATLTTEKQVFRYEDNRFEWRALTQAPVTVHWYQGATAYGQTALDVATAALAEIDHTLNLTAPEALDVYLYATDADARVALRDTGVSWANGHANPATGVAIAVVPPDVLDSNINLAMLIPHELTHLRVYRAAGGQYARVPAWLNEGLAMLHQAQPNPNFPGALSRARTNAALIPVAELCGAFPADATQAELAYAESESLVRYVRGQYGASGLTALLAAYADGLSCDAGVQRALGLSLIQLEQNWLRDEISPTPALFNLQKLAPWLGLVVLIVFSGGAFLLAMFTPAARKKTYEPFE